jgi:DNA-binding beta-propeller fold protein YncE
MALSSDEKTMYVTSGGFDGKLQAVDIASGKVRTEVAAGHTPQSPVILPGEKKMFVCNRFSNNVAEYDLPEMKFVRHIPTIREPFAAVCSKDGKQLYVANYLPNDTNNDPAKPHEPVFVAASVSVIETESGKAEHLRLPNGACNVQDICLSPEGQFVYVTHLIAHFWNETDHLEGGQMNVNGFSRIDTKTNSVDTFFLDDETSGAANPWGITTSKDGKTLYVAASGTDELITLEIADFTKKQRIKLNGKGARSVAVVGENVYVGMYYGDTLQKIVPGSGAVEEIPLGEKIELTRERAGEMYWNDATLCFEQWQSCASCHPEGRMTGMNWDLLHDGAGNPKNTKSFLLSHDTPPTMWLGDRRHAQQCTRTGFRFIMFTMPQREPCFTIDEYTRNMKPVPSPYLVGCQLSEKAKQGQTIFNDTKVGCAACHPAPLFTDLQMHDVGSKDQYSDQTTFDTPTLIEVWRTAPYMHDGRYVKMKDIFTKGKHGNVEHLSDEEIDNLVEYVLSL